jgi:cyclase
MLKIRVIPTLLWKQFGLVKGVAFDSWRRVGPVLPAVKVYNQREVDELVLFDIIAHKSNEGLDYESIKEFSEECFVPLTVGGGIKNIDDVQKLLNSGADKVTVNTFAYEKPRLISEIANRHGSQCVVACIDVRSIGSSWSCFSSSGQVETKRNPVQWAVELQDRGAGEILLTSIDRDGTMMGYDIPLVEAVVSAVQIPVIASGGAGTYKDMIDVVKHAGASAVAAASMFHFTEQTPAEAKTAMRMAGIPVRDPVKFI